MKVNNPCPMALSCMKNADGTFFCQSCAKSIVDYRGKSKSEIQSNCDEDTCGIFDDSQVERPTFSFRKGVIFTLLTVISFIGFNVGPIQAQNENKEPATKKVKKEKQREHSKSKKKIKEGERRITIGTPSF